MEESMLSRLGRLDNVLKHLEDVRSVNCSSKSSSYASANSSGTLTSDGRPSLSFVDLTAKHCRSVEEVMSEVESKGTVVERLVGAEDRILKLEEEFEKEKEQTSSAEKKKKKQGLKQLVKSCVVGKKKA